VPASISAEATLHPDRLFARTQQDILSLDPVTSRHRRLVAWIVLLLLPMQGLNAALREISGSAHVHLPGAGIGDHDDHDHDELATNVAGAGARLNLGERGDFRVTGPDFVTPKAHAGIERHRHDGRHDHGDHDMIVFDAPDARDAVTSPGAGPCGPPSTSRWTAPPDPGRRARPEPATAADAGPARDRIERPPRQRAS
jgi:hypothetical protein